MNKITLLILILFIFGMLIVAYLILFRNVVHNAGLDAGIKLSKSVSRIKDLKILYRELRYNKELGSYEKAIFWQYLILTSIWFVLCIILGILIFFTDW
jgi:hypothetical protein